LLRDNGELSEVRLDYRPAGAAGAWTITLPGFAVDVPQPRHWSMVVWRAEEQWNTGLFSTFAGNEVATAYTTFALSKADEPRRLHGDDDAESPRLLELSATILPPDDPAPAPLAPVLTSYDDEDGPTDARDDQGWTTLALATMGLEVGKPQFFRKTQYPLPPLDFSDNATLSAPISELERITEKDISATIKINPSKLPFFKRDGFQAWKQYLEIDAKPAEIDWALPGFKVTLKLMLHLGAMTGAGKFDLEADGKLNFNWERFAFSADGLDTISLKLPEPRELDFLGLRRRGEIIDSNGVWGFPTGPGDFITPE
jgi:ribosomal protein S18